MHARLSALGLAASLFIGCSSSQSPSPLKGDPGAQGPAGPQGPAGSAGATGPSGASGFTTLVVSTPEPAGSHCSGGGVMLQTALDQNANGVVDPGEIDLASTQYVCNGAQGIQGTTGSTGSTGATGASGLNSALRTTPEAVGVNCATGGVKVEAGLDADGNGVLADAEVDASLTRYVCNGAQGTQGPIGLNGLASAVRHSVEAPGGNCATGGLKLEAGLDVNGNGTLDDSEVDAGLTQFVCNGAQGPQGVPGGPGMSGFSAAMSTSVEPPGGNCATGGVQFQAGIDANGNGVLDASEVDASLTRYVCNGAQGPQGIPGGPGMSGFNAAMSTSVEAPGANCATGGVQLQAGVDANGNGVLDPGEVNASLTRYVCNGAQGSQGVPGGTGASGLNAAMTTSTEPVGANCATGGVKLQAGIDSNANGVLDPGEINASLTRYVCNGAQGSQGTTGATGPQGPAGSLGVFGDGSSGSLIISSNTDWSASSPGANLQYTDFTVNAGVTLTVPSGTVIRATGNVSIQGTINVLTAATDNGTFRPLAGVALGEATTLTGGVGLSRLQASSQVRPVMLGGGAGARNASNTGGEGGGSFFIYARGTIQVGGGGFVRANGNNAVNLNTAGAGITGGGGGAGGVVVLLSRNGISIAGSITANGGNGASGFDGNGGNSEGGGGGGGGGIVNLLSTSTPSVSGTIMVAPGSPGAGSGASATINAGGGGGACGGSGGSGGGSTASAGVNGWLTSTTLATPETLAL